MKKKIRFIYLIASFLALNLQAEEIKVGTISGSDAKIIEEVKKVAKLKYNLDIKIIEFTDYILPNSALNSGDLDANAFQHQPYLDDQIKSRGFKLVSVAKTYNSPVGVYSSKIKDLKDLKNKSVVGIPNDPTNGGRALLLMQDKGLIKLKDNIGLTPTSLDIIENSKNLNIKEISAPQLARSLDDVEIAIINSNYALDANLNPTKDAISLERKDGPYVNIIAVQEKDKNKPWVEKLINSYQSEEVKNFINKEFKGATIPSF